MASPTNRWSRVFEDVGEVTHLHGAMRNGEESFKALANILPCIVLSLAPSGLAEFVSDQWIQLTGQTLEAAGARPGAWLAALHPADRERLAGPKGETRPGAWSVDTHVRVRRAADGAFRRHSLRVSPVCDGDSVVAFVAVLAEVNDSSPPPKQTREKEGCDANDVITLARQIREVLAPISTAAWLLRRPEQVVQKRASDIIERQVERMVRVLEDFESQLALPATDGCAEPSVAAAWSTPEPMRVLLVARTHAARGITLLLTASGHATQIARDLSQAIEMSQIFNPHIVMVDVDSAGEDTCDAICRLRKEKFLPRATFVELAGARGRGVASARSVSRMTCFDYELTMPVTLTQLEHILAAARARGPFP